MKNKEWWIFGGIVIGVFFCGSLGSTLYQKASGIRESGSTRLSEKEFNICFDNIRRLDAALALYAEDNGGFLPPENGAEGLDYLRKAGLITDYAVFICPDSGLSPAESGILTEEHCSYVFYGRTRLPNHAEELLLLDKPGNHPGTACHIVYGDRRIESKK